MSALNQGDVIEVPARHLLAWSDYPIGDSTDFMLLVLRDADGPLVRVRVISRNDKYAGWCAVPRTLYLQTWVWRVPSDIPIALVPLEKVMRVCHRTEEQIMGAAKDRVLA